MPARLSPDGKLLAYASDESGRVEVYVQSFPTPGNKVLISANGGDQPAWRRDGKELYYLAPDHKLMAVAVKPGATFDGGEPQVPFQTRAPATNLLSIRNHYAPAADGLKFLVRTMPEGQSTVPLVILWAVLCSAAVLVWWHRGSASSLFVFPKMNLDTASFWPNIAFGITGIELMGMMGGEIADPRRDVRRTALVSAVFGCVFYISITLSLLVLSSVNSAPLSSECWKRVINRAHAGAGLMENGTRLGDTMKFRLKYVKSRAEIRLGGADCADQKF
jgi:hypothetical protein